MAFPAPPVDRQLDLAQRSSLKRQRRSQTTKTFIIEKVRRLSPKNPVAGEIRRILIFDDHPESLRLIFGRRSNADVDFSETQHASLWEFVLAAALTFGALIGVFWPLF